MVSVKLVSEVGVGDGGSWRGEGKRRRGTYQRDTTAAPGASPLSSIKHAGTPWEIGLAETQQTLVLNGLRDRSWWQADGR